jgi:hypothetical protein
MGKWATKIVPNKRGRYLVTIETEFGRQVRQADRYFAHYGKWAWSLLPHGLISDKKVVAWQKCPQPFKEE